MEHATGLKEQADIDPPDDNEAAEHQASPETDQDSPPPAEDHGKV